MSRHMEVALRAAHQAGDAVMKHFDATKQISFKGKVDLVTNADIESEKIIKDILSKEFPNHGLVMEEAGVVESMESDYRWIIDPIDGTTSFAHNYPFFSVSIALFKGRERVLGVVYAPYLKETFSAEKGKGAFMNGKRISVSSTEAVINSLIATGFPYHRIYSDDDNVAEFSRAIKKVGGIRRDGSAALDLCYVACGRLDGYWERFLKVVDSAAGVLIVEEAGGSVTDMRLDPIADDYSEVLATNGRIHKEMHEILYGNKGGER